MFAALRHQTHKRRVRSCKYNQGYNHARSSVPTDRLFILIFNGYINGTRARNRAVRTESDEEARDIFQS